MLEIKKLTIPSPEQFEIVIHGMRSPFKSWDKGDSIICNDVWMEKEACYNGCPYVDHWKDEPPYSIPICGIENEEEKVFVLGENDKQLLLNLCKAGDPSHRKILRQLPVIMDIRAPLYWHKQMDQYKVGTVTNSESTMHCMVKEPFKVEDFSTEHINLIPKEYEWGEIIAETHLNTTIELLNQLRKKYLETKDMNYWYAINEFLPQSYNQTRTWSGNYETLVNIIKQRRGHKLKEWHTFCEYVLDNVPYLKEIVEAVND